MTIQVKYTPRKEVYIHEMSIYNNIDEMLAMLTRGLSAGMLGDTLRWVNGVALTFNPIPNTTEFIIKERSRGILRWDHVSFAPMKNYQERFNLDNGVVVNVADVSMNETFCAIGKFLKKYINKK